MTDKVFLKVSLVKEVRKFNVSGELSPRNIRPYVTEKLNPMMYILDFHAKLEYVHNVFHI